MNASSTATNTESTSVSPALMAALADAIAEVNRQLPADTQLNTDDETVLAGEHGVLDSLGLLGFLVAVEQQVELRFGVQLSLVGADLAVGADDGPLSCLRAFADDIATRIESLGSTP